MRDITEEQTPDGPHAPVGILPDGTIANGHLRVEAAKALAVR